LLVLLFIAVVISLRMGAYPISIPEIVATLFNRLTGRTDQIPSEFLLVVFGLRLPRIALGIIHRRGRFSGTLAESLGRPLRAGRF
jgi:ABC-type Fe3+-siderophore transport system permease subunit